MLFYMKVTVMLMSLDVGKNPGTAILLISAIIHALIGFLYTLFPPSIILYELVRDTNYSFVRVSNINIRNITFNNKAHG